MNKLRKDHSPTGSAESKGKAFPTGEAFEKEAERVERYLKSLPFPAKPRSAGRPKSGEEVEETETFTIRLPKSLLLKLTQRAHLLRVSRNKFFNSASIDILFATENMTAEAYHEYTQAPPKQVLVTYKDVQVADIQPNLVADVLALMPNTNPQSGEHKRLEQMSAQQSVVISAVSYEKNGPSVKSSRTFFGVPAGAAP